MSTQIPNADRLAKLHREALNVIATLPSRDALGELCGLVEAMFPATTCRIGARVGETTDFVWFDSHHRAALPAHHLHSTPVRACLDVFETGAPVYTNRVPSEPSWGTDCDSDFARPRGYWVHPVEDHHRKTIGTLTLTRVEPGAPSDSERDLLLTLTQLAAIGLGRLLAETEQAASDERFRSLVETTQDLIWETDKRGRLTYTNPRFEDHFGVHRRSIESALEIRLRAGPATQPLESSIVTPDGEVRYFETMVTPIESPRGEIEGYRGISREVTRRKKLEDERYRLENAIQRRKRIESLGLLAGGVAHDFNNLLVGVKGSVDLIERFPDEDELPEHLARIRAAADHAAELCRKLLRYAGRDEPRRAPVAPNELVEETVDVVSTVAKSCRLELDLVPTDPVVEGDAAQLRQMLLNLVMNATQSLPHGRGTVRVSTSLRRVRFDEANQFILAGKPGQYVEITVSDDGSGIPPELIEQIFTPFFTTKSEGHGLGLATTLGTVRDHHGMLDVESEPGQGTVFTVLIPYQEVKRPVAAAHLTIDVDRIRGRSVLVVEDERSIRAVLKRSIESVGAKVEIAENGMEALALLEDQATPVDLLVLDHSMPVMNGAELIEAARARAISLRAVLTSGNHRWPRPINGERFEELPKPYDVSAVLSAISRLLTP